MLDWLIILTIKKGLWYNFLRKTQADFVCVICEFKENADLVGAINILRAGRVQLACEVNDAVMSSAAAILELLGREEDVNCYIVHNDKRLLGQYKRLTFSP